MVEVEVVPLENGKKYMILDTIEIDGIKYIYLSQIENDQEFCIRKLSLDELDILGLDSEEEYNKALKAYAEKEKSAIS